jgi:Deacetylase PdaC
MRTSISMHSKTLAALAVALGFALILGACKKDDASSQTQVETPAQPALPQPAIDLKDVIEQDARYIIGISYPPAAKKYPGLAEALHRYAEGARAELLKSVQAADPAKQNGPFELSLNFTLQAETPDIVAVGVEGTSYTGGAHGAPLVARFVWLPQQSRLLTANDLFPEAASWVAISDYAREELHASLSQRVDADELPPAERAEVMRTVGRMIDEGTEPTPASFAAFEPVLAPDGQKLMALRFVFPPYQVGPYIDGVRSVEVPTSVLAPMLAAEFRSMFVSAQPAPVAAVDPSAPPALQSTQQ